MTASGDGVDAGGGAPRRRILGRLRLVYLAALAALLGWLVWTRRSDLAVLVAGTRPAWLALAFVLALGQLTPSVLLWTTATRRIGGVPIRAVDVATVTARSVPTRYLPGSVWYALGRATLLRRDHGVPLRALAATAALETILAVVVAIAAGSALLVAAGRVPARAAWLGAWFAVLAVAGSPPAVDLGLRLLARWRDRPAPPPIGWSTWGRLVAITGLHWLWSATTFVVFLRAFPRLATLPTLEVAGSFLIAWVVGFLAVFAPQGAGVFEATVAAMLVDDATAGAAVVVAGYRAIMLVRDVAVFTLAGLGGRRSRGRDGG